MLSPRYKTREEYVRMREDALRRYPKETIRALAKEYGITERTIRQWVRDAGLPRRGGGRPNPHADKAEDVLKLYGGGASYPEIIEQLGVTRSFITKTVREARKA